MKTKINKPVDYKVGIKLKLKKAPDVLKHIVGQIFNVEVACKKEYTLKGHGLLVLSRKEITNGIFQFTRVRQNAGKINK